MARAAVENGRLSAGDVDSLSAILNTLAPDKLTAVCRLAGAAAQSVAQNGGTSILTVEAAADMFTVASQELPTAVEAGRNMLYDSKLSKEGVAAPTRTWRVGCPGMPAAAFRLACAVAENGGLAVEDVDALHHVVVGASPQLLPSALRLACAAAQNTRLSVHDVEAMT